MKDGFLSRNIVVPLKNIFSRFPMAALFSLGFFAFWSYYIFVKETPESAAFYFSLTMLFGFFLSLSIELLREKYKNNAVAWLYLAMGAYLGIFYYFNYSTSTWYDENFTMIVIRLFAFGLFPFWVAYKWRDATEIRYDNFFKSVVNNILLTAGISIIVFLLGSIAIWSVGKLFDLYENFTFFDFSRLNVWWNLFSITLFSSYYLLANFPHYNGQNAENHTLTKAEIFLIKNIGVPFVILYFVILYAYSVRVLLNFWNWPHGIISYLVIVFSAIGYYTYMKTRHLEGKNRVIEIFQKYLPWAVFFQLFMLFYAIYLRIAQYGLTTNRYLVVIIGGILLVISLYLIIAKRKRLVMIPMMFSCLALFMSIGPWGIFALPKTLQYNDLIAKLEQTGRYRDGKIVTENLEMLDYENSKIILEKINYLCNSSDCTLIKKLFESILENPENSYRIHEKIAEKLLLQEVIYGTHETIPDNVRNYDLTAKKSEDRSEKISGYDWSIGGSNKYSDGFDHDNTLRKSQNFYAMVDGKNLVLTHYGEVIETYDLSDFIAKIVDEFKQTNSKSMKLQFIGIGEKYDIQANISYIKIAENIDTHEQNIREIYFGTVLVKEK